MYILDILTQASFFSRGLLEDLLERLPRGEETRFSLRQAVLFLVQALAEPNPQCAMTALSSIRGNFKIYGTGISLKANFALFFLQGAGVLVQPLKLFEEV